ncbi:hypothetical protein Tco_0525004 [Tanacetum coccineum]
MDQPQTIRLPFTGVNLYYKHRRLEFTKEEIRYFETYKDEFLSNGKAIVMDAKAIHAAMHKRNELALAELATAELLSADDKGKGTLDETLDNLENRKENVEEVLNIV